MALPVLPAKVTTHEADAVARLVYQYVNKPNMEALAGIIGARAQTLEDATWELVTKRTIAAGTGMQLDDLGAILGEPRQGRTDADYRIYLSARILLNKCSGTPDQIIVLFETVLAAMGAQTVVLQEWATATVIMVVSGIITSAQATELALLLKRARGGGINGQVEWAPQAPATTFTFGPEAVASDGVGYDGATVINTEGYIPQGWPTTGSTYVTDSHGRMGANYTKTGFGQFTLDQAVNAAMNGVLWFTLVNPDKGFSDLTGTTPISGGSFAGIKEG